MSSLNMRRIATRWLWPIAIALFTAQAHAAEIVLERSAVDKLVARALYKDNGRYYLQRGACHAYLEQPQVMLDGGRIRIRTRLIARIGQPAGDTCMGQAFNPWVTVSGEPAASAGVVRLQKLKVEQVSDPMVQLMLDAGLAALPGVVELDVLKAVRDMLSTAEGDLRGRVERLDIASVAVADNRLHIRFDFRLVAE
jgi:hypothetical protein